MAVAFRSIANTTYASRTNTTVTAPASIADDDILVLLGFSGAAGASPTMTPPTGFAAFTLAAGVNPTSVTDGSFNGRMWAWWKRAASESGDYTITHTACSSQGACMAISGAITSGDPYDVANSNEGEGSDGLTTTTGLAVTTTVADTLLVFWAHDWADTAVGLTAPTGMTERLDVTLMYVATQAIAATGTTGDRTMTNNNASNGANDAWGVYMIAIKPPAAAGGILFSPIVGAPGRLAGRRGLAG